MAEAVLQRVEYPIDVTECTINQLLKCFPVTNLSIYTVRDVVKCATK